MFSRFFLAKGDNCIDFLLASLDDKVSTIEEKHFLAEKQILFIGLWKSKFSF